MTTPGVTHDDAPRAGARAWVSLGVLVLPVLLISVDMTVLGFAVPHLSTDLGPSGTQLLWIVDIYSFMLAGLLVTMGTLGDRIGRRRLLLVGAFGFGAASLVAAFSTSPEMLIAARALLGIAGATLMPATLSLLRNIFLNRRQRLLAIAVWSSAFSAGAALGPVLGGWLLEHFWWGSVFLINLPVMVVTLVLGRTLLPESRDPNPGRYDLPSVALSMMALLAVVFGIKKLVAGDSVLLAVVALAVGVGAGALFVRRQLRLPNPLLDVRLFAIRPFSVGVVTNLILTFALVGTLFSLTQFLQLVLGLSPMRAGLVLVPGMALTVAFGFVAVPLARRLPMGLLLLVGLSVATLGLVLLGSMTPDTGITLAVFAFVLVGVGVGFSDTITNDAILASAPPEKAGAASAISETAYELGAALGVAVLGSILTVVYSTRIGVVPDVPASAMTEARETLGGAVEAARDLPADVATSLVATAQDAFTQGLQIASLAGAVLVAYAGVQAFLALRRVRPQELTTSTRGMGSPDGTSTGEAAVSVATPNGSG
uniref:MFS transporter n=1 Tax=Spiractinospora alimapuensis TaxID=2820884 RepID=UPI0037449B58